MNDYQGWTGLKFRPPRMSDLFKTTLAPNKCKFCGRRYNLSCVMSLLPDEETCKTLCNLFFANVFPLMPILHVRGFAEDFKDFWNGSRRGNVHDSEPNALLRKKPGFLCLLSSILFSALASTSKSRCKSALGEANVPDTGDMYFAAMVSANLTGFPRRPSIYSLAAYIFTQSQFMREEEFSDAPDFISTSFRVALGMGLHRHFPEARFSNSETESRRRIWWYILHLDVMSSCSSGLSPLFVDEKMSNADPISHYDGSSGAGASENEGSRASSTSLRSRFNNFKLQFIFVLLWLRNDIRLLRKLGLFVNIILSITSSLWTMSTMLLDDLKWSQRV